MQIETLFIFDEYMNENFGNQPLQDTMHELNIPYVLAETKGMNNWALEEIYYQGPILIIGTMAFCNWVICNKAKMANPGLLGYRYSSMTEYRSYMNSDLFLNQGYFLTWKMFWDSQDVILPKFIRPNSGSKVFTGQIIQNLDDKKLIESTSSVLDTTLIFISEAKQVLDEYRFVIIDGQVISSSPYSWEHEIDQCVPISCYALAEKISKLDFQMDTGYTLDITLDGDTPKIIELNSLSSASLYNCDINKVVDSMNRSAKKEFYDF